MPRAEPPAPAKEDDGDRDKFRKQISRLTGQKGVNVYFGTETVYDPLARALVVDRNTPMTDEAAQEAASLVGKEQDLKWRAAMVKATIEDGSEVEVSARQAADLIGEKLRKALATLECMG